MSKNSFIDDNKKLRLSKVVETLKTEYPVLKPALNFSTPFELLVATILSAQCTDARVNIVTKDLFKKYKSPKDYIAVSHEELAKDIYSTGFYNQKAKSLQKCCAELVEKYNGKVPADFEKLTKLSGVGRKTASVVAGNAFGIPSIAVDTHVIRLTNLLGFVETKDPKKIEQKLKELLPEKDWVDITHLLISHGRKICVARKPKCFECVVADYCINKNIRNNK